MLFGFEVVHRILQRVPVNDTPVSFAVVETQMWPEPGNADWLLNGWWLIFWRAGKFDRDRAAIAVDGDLLAADDLLSDVAGTHHCRDTVLTSHDGSIYRERVERHHDAWATRRRGALYSG